MIDDKLPPLCAYSYSEQIWQGQSRLCHFAVKTDSSSDGNLRSSGVRFWIMFLDQHPNVWAPDLIPLHLPRSLENLRMPGRDKWHWAKGMSLWLPAVEWVASVLMSLGLYDVKMLFLLPKSKNIIYFNANFQIGPFILSQSLIHHLIFAGETPPYIHLTFCLSEE